MLEVSEKSVQREASRYVMCRIVTAATSIEAA